MKLLVLLSLLISIPVFTFAQNKQVDVKNSKIMWVGKKITGQHDGTVDLQKGTLVLKKNGDISGGKFIIDMTTISCTDLSGDSKAKLDGHLKGADFFDVSKFPTSTLEFKKISKKSDGNYAVTANLTLKGQTKPISFILVAKNGQASSNLSIDRTKFGIQYGSGTFFQNLGDKAISDQFEINISFAY